MAYTTDYRSLALSGMVQAAQLVHACANGTAAPPAAVNAVKNAIATHHAASLEEVFAVNADFKLGVECAISALSGNLREGGTTPEVLRYGLRLLELAGRLARNPEALKRLAAELDDLPQQPSDAEYARIYQHSISPLGKSIQVTGNPGLLQQPAVAQEIRSLLLAGVRFAWLWLQLGGRRWQLILQRRPVLSALDSLNNTL